MQNKMAEKELCLLVLLLCCLLLQENNIIMMNHFYVLKRLLLTQAVEKGHRKCKIKERRNRRYWVRPGKTKLWWSNFLNGIVLDEEWKENFRMSKQNFFNLAGLLRPFI